MWKILNEWMNTFVPRILSVVFFAPSIYTYIFFFRTWPYVLWRVSADCNSLLTYIMHNIRVVRWTMSSPLRPGFCIAQLDLNLQHAYVIRYDSLGYSERRFSFSWITQVTSASTFSPIGFSTVHDRYSDVLSRDWIFRWQLTHIRHIVCCNGLGRSERYG